MNPYPHILTWITASRREALLARHLRIEEIDLLLGLIAQGGPLAQDLGGRGVSLARARRAAAELDDADLAAAGIEMAPGARPERLRASARTLASEVDLEWTPGAEAIIFERRGRVRDNRQALRALLARPQGESARLLHRLGVDPQALEARLEAMGEQDASAARSLAVPEPYRGQGLQRATMCTHFVSAPPPVVRRLLSDPSRLQEWLVVDARAVEPGDAGAVSHYRSRFGSGRMDHRLETGEDGALVWWTRALSGRYRGAVSTVHRIRLEEAEGGTLVHLTLMSRSFGVLGRVMGPLAGLFRGMGLRHQLLAVAALCADEITTGEQGDAPGGPGSRPQD